MSLMESITANQFLLDVTQTFENPGVREYLKLDKSVEGCIIHRPYSTGERACTEGVGCHHTYW